MRCASLSSIGSDLSFVQVKIEKERLRKESEAKLRQQSQNEANKRAQVLSLKRRQQSLIIDACFAMHGVAVHIAAGPLAAQAAGCGVRSWVSLCGTLVRWDSAATVRPVTADAAGA